MTLIGFEGATDTTAKPPVPGLVGFEHVRRIPPPYAHQAAILAKTKDLDAWALFLEMRVGKSRIAIETAIHAFKLGRIKYLVVVADNGVHSNWATDELPAWMPDDFLWKAAVYNSSKASTKRHSWDLDNAFLTKGLGVLCITYDGAITEGGKKALWRFLKPGAMLVCDESSSCKSPRARRTLTLIAAAKHAKIRRILNGTPIDRSPFDIYSQIRLISPDFWSETLGIASFGAFKAQFANMMTFSTSGGQQFEKVTSYKNLDQLHAALQLISSRVTRDEVFDLPPKVYGVRPFEMSSDQERIYNDLKRSLVADLGAEVICPSCEGKGSTEYAGDSYDCMQCGGSGKVREGGIMTAANAGVKLMRLQQVLNGYQCAEGEPVTDIPGPNHRLDALEAEVAQTAGPWIVWTRFQRDVDKIAERGRALGFRVGTFDGRTSTDDRIKVRQAFQAGSLDWFVANPAAAGKGIRLTEANSVIYYSNSFRLINRLQSEDRPVAENVKRALYISDILCRGTLDEHVIKNLRAKIDVAAQITGDKVREWLA